MTSYRIREEAERDLESVAAYSRARWGVERTVLYIERLRDTASLLAARPGLGRPYGRKPPFRRFEEGQHVLFFVVVDVGIEIVRILHERQDPDRL